MPLPAQTAKPGAPKSASNFLGPRWQLMAAMDRSIFKKNEALTRRARLSVSLDSLELLRPPPSAFRSIGEKRSLWNGGEGWAGKCVLHDQFGTNHILQANGRSHARCHRMNVQSLQSSTS